MIWASTPYAFLRALIHLAEEVKWDTANVYSNGASEEIVGKAIKKYDIPRTKLVIMTKCFSTVGEEPSIRSTALHPLADRSKDYVNQSGNPRL